MYSKLAGWEKGNGSNKRLMEFYRKGNYSTEITKREITVYTV